MASISGALRQDLKSLRQYTTETAMDACTTARAGGLIVSNVWGVPESWKQALWNQPRTYDFANHPPEPYCWMN